MFGKVYAGSITSNYGLTIGGDSVALTPKILSINADLSINDAIRNHRFYAMSGSFITVAASAANPTTLNIDIQKDSSNPIFSRSTTPLYLGICVSSTGKHSYYTLTPSNYVDADKDGSIIQSFPSGVLSIGTDSYSTQSSAILYNSFTFDGLDLGNRSKDDIFCLVFANTSLSSLRTDVTAGLRSKAVGICYGKNMSATSSGYTGVVYGLDGNPITISNKYIGWCACEIIHFKRIIISNSILSDNGISALTGNNATFSVGYRESIKLNTGLDFGQKINITSVVNPFKDNITSGIAIGSGIGAGTVGDGQIAIGMAPYNPDAVVTLGTGKDKYYTYFNMASSGWTVKSDKRDKIDIIPITNALRFVNELNPVSFKMNFRGSYVNDGVFDEENYKKGTHKSKYKTGGLLAQDVVAALEDVYGDKNYTSIVDHVTDDNPLKDNYSMSYEALIPYLIGAIKELTSTVESQAKEIEMLKNQL